MPLSANTRLGQYEVVAFIGGGGMGDVYRATDTKLRRDVAIKVLKEDLARDAARLKRFEHEAVVLASLNHPNIATLHGFEESGSTRFLVMELVEGKTLSQLLASSGTIEILQILVIASGISEGLAAAHAKGIVHRDLKPGNVMMLPDERVKILDFGLAKRVPTAQLSGAGAGAARSEPLSEPGEISGTVPYMSPEQCEAAVLDSRSDLFSLGIVLYELSTGQRPFRGHSAYALMAQILQSDPPEPVTLRTDLPLELQRIVQRCLRKAPAERYQSTQDLALDLKSLQQSVALGRAVSPALMASARRAQEQAARQPSELSLRSDPSALQSAGDELPTPILVEKPSRPPEGSPPRGEEAERDAERQLERGRRAIAEGESIRGFDLLWRALEQYPAHEEIRYLCALALARTGGTEEAARCLSPLVASVSSQSPLYSDVLSLAGRIAKDRWTFLGSDPDRRRAAQESARWYRAAFDLSRSVFPGVNAATMTLLGGDPETARILAARVVDIARGGASLEEDHDHWRSASLGEAYLLLDRVEDALQAYLRARELVGDHLGDLGAMRRQLMLIRDHVPTAERCLEVLTMPRVIAVTGHMIDAADRDTPRFPIEIEPAVRREIEAVLERLDARFAYGQAACGTDLLAHESMIARGGQSHVVLPFAQDDFLRESVGFAGQGWVDRFHRALERATSVVCATEESYLGDDTLFTYAADVAQGKALLHAEQLGTEAVLLAVIDPDQTGFSGGARETLELWRRSGRPAEVIDLARIRREAKIDEARPASRPAPGRRKPGAAVRRTVHAMLIADVAGFSNLGEAQSPLASLKFLGRVADLLRDFTPAPVSVDTRGDRLHASFDDVTGASSFALRLAEMVAGTRWEDLGLPHLSVRARLHAGPVHAAVDPVAGGRTFVGSHVNRAARMQPIDLANSVFATDACASLLAVANAGDVVCEYAGKPPRAEGDDSSALYRLRSLTAASK